jgi:hypothetical protein
MLNKFSTYTSKFNHKNDAMIQGSDSVLKNIT